MHWIAYKLTNCQSWSDKSPVVKLSKDKVNVIHGRNETGKSVLFKMIKSACFPNYSYNPEDLIRWGADYAQVQWLISNPEISNKTIQVVYFIIRKKSFIYRVIIDDKIQEWSFAWNDRDAAMPEEVADLLGLILDRKSHTVINVIEKAEQPFINTQDSETDARILASILYDSKMEGLQDNLAVQLEKLDRGVRISKTIMDEKRQIYVSTPHYDLYRMEQYINILDEFVRVIQKGEAWINESEKLAKLDPPVKFYPDVDIKTYSLFWDLFGAYSKDVTSLVQYIAKPKPIQIFDSKVVHEISPLLDILYKMEECVDIFSEVEVPKKEIPEIPSLPILEDCILLIDEVLKNIDSLIKLYENKPSCVNELSTGNNALLKLCNGFNILTNYIDREYSKLSPPGIVNTDIDISSVIGLWKLIQYSISEDVMKLLNLNVKINRNNTILQELSELKEDMSDIVKICPTCGQPINLNGGDLTHGC